MVPPNQDRPSNQPTACIRLPEIFEWDVVNWSRALPFWQRFLPPRVDGSPPLTALELGARRGGPSLWLASLGIDVVCSDLEDPQPRAAPHHQRFAVPGQIRYEAFSATDIPYREQFDVVVLKSVLGAIARPDDLEPRREALRQCHLALRPGGVLLFAENLRGSAMHRFLRRHFVAWGRRWAYLDVREIPAEFAHFAELHCATFGFLGALGRSESQRRILGRLDRFLVPLLPPSQHYLVYGVARR